MKVGDFVLYSTKGICKVQETEKMKLGAKAQNYFVLAPVFDKNSTYYVPEDYDPTKVKIRDAIEASDVDELLKFSKECEPYEWLQNDHERKTKNEEILKSEDHHRLIRLIKTLNGRERHQKSIGKKMYLSDARALQSAIKLISNEFAFVKGRDIKEMEEYFKLAV